MSLRRGATRLAAVFALLAGFVAIGAAPAQADEDDRMQLRLPSSFTAGGSPGSVTVSVSKRSDGCVDVRTALGIRLAGLSPDQLQVRVASDGEWRPVGVSSAGDGVVVTDRTAPEKDKLCKRRSIALRYEVTFLDGAPGGSADVLAGAYAAGGDLVAQTTARRTVKGPSPRPSLSPSVTPTPTPTPTAEPTEVATAAPQQTQAAVPAVVGKPQDSGRFGVGTAVMALGVAMVGIGIGLLVLLLRRGRGDRDDPGAGGYPQAWPPPGGGDHTPTLILPKLPR
jgi:hypothetical protein